MTIRESWTWIRRTGREGYEEERGGGLIDKSRGTGGCEMWLLAWTGGAPKELIMY
jgi:hypothetical protein